MYHHTRPLIRPCAIAAALVMGPMPLQAADVDADNKPAAALREASWEQVQTDIAGHRGQVVVVDVWTTTCPTCVAELPKFVALARRHPEGVVWLTVNCDYDGIEGKPPAFYRPDVLAVLNRAGATAGATDNVMLTLPFIDFLEKLELASSPAVFVYRPDGRLAKRFDNDVATSAEEEFSLGDVERLVQELRETKDPK
jgi:thiol-disulfide isomerase/thioredoxin